MSNLLISSCIQGGYKYRDGINRNMTGNLMVKHAEPVFQVFGFSTDYFNFNYLWGQKKPICGPSDVGGLHSNIFLQQSDTAVQTRTTDGEASFSSYVANGGMGEEEAFLVRQAGASKCDNGIRESWPLKKIQEFALNLVGLQS